MAINYRSIETNWLPAHFFFFLSGQISNQWIGYNRFSVVVVDDDDAFAIVVVGSSYNDRI